MVFFFSFCFFNTRPPTPILQKQPRKYLQAEAHVQIILGKPVTSLATEMRKMALMSVTFSLPTYPTPTRWNVHLSNVTQFVE